MHTCVPDVAETHACAYHFLYITSEIINQAHTEEKKVMPQ